MYFTRWDHILVLKLTVFVVANGWWHEYELQLRFEEGLRGEWWWLLAKLSPINTRERSSRKHQETHGWTISWITDYQTDRLHCVRLGCLIWWCAVQELHGELWCLHSCSPCTPQTLRLVPLTEMSKALVWLTSWQWHCFFFLICNVISSSSRHVHLLDTVCGLKLQRMWKARWINDINWSYTHAVFNRSFPPFLFRFDLKLCFRLFSRVFTHLLRILISCTEK